MSHDLDQIKVVPIAGVIEKLIGEQPNRQKFWKCPFHAEKTPSLHVRPGTNGYKCFGCSASGTVIDFVMNFLGVEFVPAVAWLADYAGIRELDYRPLTPRGKAAKAPKVAVPLAKKDLRFQQEASANLRANPHLLDSFAADRGFSQTSLSELVLEGSLGVIGIDNSDPEKQVGLVFRYETGTKIRHQMNDSRSSRWLAGKARFNVWRLGMLAERHTGAVIFEGETDLITAASWMLDPGFNWYPGSVHGGYPGAIVAAPSIETHHWCYLAAPGASWRPTPEQAARIGLRRTVRLCYDNDQAGRDATREVAEIFSRVSGCKVEAWDWSIGAGTLDRWPAATDIGDVGAMAFGENFNCNFINIT